MNEWNAAEEKQPDEDEQAAAGRGLSRRPRPDFLQETPEHDRLLFEQKPPSDFDFD